MCCKSWYLSSLVGEQLHCPKELIIHVDCMSKDKMGISSVSDRLTEEYIDGGNINLEKKLLEYQAKHNILQDVIY